MREKPTFPTSESELISLSEVDRPLDNNEMNKVINHIPWLVLADDDPQMRRLGSEVIRRLRRDIGSVMVLDEGRVPDRFESLEKFRGNDLPILMCNDGNEASQAARIICDQQMAPGILALDQDMGGPSGIDILEMYQDELPAGLTRIIQSANEPDELDNKIKSGLLDDYANKIGVNSLPVILRAYLKRTFGDKSK